MDETRLIYISVELTAALLGALYSSVLFFSTNNEAGNGRTMMRLCVCNTVLLIFDALAWYLRGTGTATGWWLVRIANFIVFECNYIMLILFTEYISNLTESNGAWKKLAITFGIIGMTVIGISQFTGWIYYFDAQNFYHRTSLYWLTSVIGLAILLVNMMHIINNRSRMSKSMFNICVVYFLLPLVAILIQTRVYGFSLSNIASAISVTLLSVVTAAERTRISRENFERLHRQNVELHDLQNRMIISQVQPHFLFNSLNAIYYLIEKDPRQAKKAVDQFSTYLRSNVSALGDTKMIPFDKEVEHIKSYLNLEQMRFGEELNVVWHIRAVNFELPPMSIQPLVENAVNHGIKKNENGGTVTISSYEEKNSYVITVQDDGVGFNPNDPLTNPSAHVGLRSVKERIQYMCQGTVEVQSSPGNGALITVRIPKKQNVKTDE